MLFFFVDFEEGKGFPGLVGDVGGVGKGLAHGHSVASGVHKGSDVVVAYAYAGYPRELHLLLLHILAEVFHSVEAEGLIRHHDVIHIKAYETVDLPGVLHFDTDYGCRAEVHTGLRRGDAFLA